MTIAARFEVMYRQYLNAEGIMLETLPESCQSKDTLIDMYKTMCLVRAFDKKAIALQRTGKMGTYAPITGQEAISTAIGHAMHPEDVLVPYYRDYGAQFQRGVKMSDILSYWGGDERGSDFEHNKEDLPISVPIASQCLHATGVAFAFKYRKQPRVALTCIGDGGTSEGDFYEAINVAGAWHLPVVFVINNNQWAISVPLSEQTACKTLAQKAIAAGFIGVQVDGNDIIACREVIGEAIERARRGEGPTLIEAISYRLSDHTTADDATRYQPEADVSAARTREPIHRFGHYLRAQKLWNDDREREWEAHCQEEVSKAVESYLNRPKQPVTALFDYHYAEMPEYLQEQRMIAMEEAEHD